MLALATQIKEQLGNTRRAIMAKGADPQLLKACDNIEQAIADADFDKIMKLITQLNDQLSKS